MPENQLLYIAHLDRREYQKPQTILGLGQFRTVDSRGECQKLRSLCVDLQPISGVDHPARNPCQGID